MDKQEMLKNHAGNIEARLSVENKIKKLEREMYMIDRDISGTYTDLKEELIKIKAERVRLLRQARVELERKINEVEKILKEALPYLTGLEYILLQKRYSEGLSWDEICEELGSGKEGRNFIFERSTYMRVHRSALDKLGIPKGEPRGGWNVQKAKRD